MRVLLESLSLSVKLFLCLYAALLGACIFAVLEVVNYFI